MNDQLEQQKKDEKLQKKKKMEERFKRLVMALVMLILLATLGICLLFGWMVWRSAQNVINTSPSVGVVIKSTGEPAPTSKPIEEIATPTPRPLTVREIENARDTMTDLQWKNYKQSVTGATVRFSGSVSEVYKDGKVSIDADGADIWTSVILHNISLDTALAINNGQRIQGVGTVDVKNILGVYIRINVTELQ